MASPSRLARCCDEPFRVFFPLGLLASIIGVALWPASFAGGLDYYPLEAHARWMILGFGGCMITGFLGTAGPRLLGSPTWSPFELILHLTMALIMMICLLLNEITKADFTTCFWFLGILGSMLWRLLLDREDLPPPGLPLVFLGLLLAAVAGFALALGPLLNYRYEWNQFWRLLYFQGILWLPIIGVAPYLLPRFFGRASRHSFDDSPNIPRGWKIQLIFSLVAGALLLTSFVIEAWWNPKFGLIFRALTITLSLGFSVPGLVSFTRANGLALATRLIIPAAVTGWLLAAFFPYLRVGVSHVMLISGSGALMLAVASRVILGHHDRHDRLASPLRWYHLIWSGLLFTAATRLSADFIPKVRQSHLSYAAALWAIIIIFWAIKISKELHKPREDEERPRRRCPKKPENSVTPSNNSAK